MSTITTTGSLKFTADYSQKQADDGLPTLSRSGQNATQVSWANGTVAGQINVAWVGLLTINAASAPILTFNDLDSTAPGLLNQPAVTLAHLNGLTVEHLADDTAATAAQITATGYGSAGPFTNAGEGVVVKRGGAFGWSDPDGVAVPPGDGLTIQNDTAHAAHVRITVHGRTT